MPSPVRCPILTATAAALAAALLAWLIGETGPVWAKPREVPQLVLGRPITATTTQSEQAAVVVNAVRQYALTGVLLGLALGATGGLSRRAAIGAAVGALVAGSAAAIASWAAVPLFYRHRYAFADEIIPSFLVHGTIWALVGAAAGLGLAIVRGGTGLKAIQAVIGAALGALVGTAAYEIVSAVLFSSADGGEPVPGSSATRLVSRLLVALGLALGAAAGLGDRKRQGEKTAEGQAADRG